jgi:deoxyribonuclease V
VEQALDFYAALRELIAQVPEEMTTTPPALASALGDMLAAKAVMEALQRSDMADQRGSVSFKPEAGSEFRSFRTDKPLQRLAQLQEKNAGLVIQEDLFGSAKRVAGVDVAYNGDDAYAACVVMDEDVRVSEVGYFRSKATFPYIPSYLSFREAEPAIGAAREISGFDVLLVNGHGVAHPRGCGLASQIGLILDATTIGVATGMLAKEARSAVPSLYLVLEGRVVGVRLGTQGKPIYVSVGHRIRLDTAVMIVRKLTSGVGLPDPLKAAHREALRFKRRGVPPL